MANQLQWQMVDAPRLDTRDLAIAGQTVDNAFGRFADILNARDARLKKDATDNASAQLMAAQTPEQLAALQQQAAAGGFGPRANMREILSVGNQRQADMLQNSARQQQIDIGKEDLLNKQDMAQHSDLYTAYDAALAKGDRAGADAIAGQIRTNGGGRNLYAVGIDGQKMYGDWRDAAERERSNRANEANAAARLAMDHSRFNLELKDRHSMESGLNLSAMLADKLGAYNTDDASSLARDSKEYKALDPIAKRAFDSDFKNQHAAITQITQDVKNKTMGSQIEVGKKVADLTSQQLAAEAPIRNDPTYRTLVQGAKPDSSITLQSIADKVGSFDGKWFKSGTRDQLRELRNSVRGPDGNPISLEDFNAVIDNTALRNDGFLSSVSGSNDFYAKLKTEMQNVVDARASGKLETMQQDLSAKGGQYAGQAAALQGMLAQKQQYMRRGLSTDQVDKNIANSLGRGQSQDGNVKVLAGMLQDFVTGGAGKPAAAAPSTTASGSWSDADAKEYKGIMDKRMAHIRSGGTGPDITQAEFDRMNALLKKRGSN